MPVSVMSFKSMSDKIYAACELILFAVTILTWIKRDFTGLIAIASLGSGISRRSSSE